MSDQKCVVDLRYICARDTWTGDALPPVLPPYMVDKGMNYFNNNCKVAGMKRALTDAYGKEFAKMIRSGTFPYHDLEQFQELSMPDVSKYMLVTVNPKPDCKLPDLIKAVDKYVKRQAIKAAMWCFEQRSSTEADMGQGPHAHILIEQEFQSKSQFHKRTESTFNKVCDLSSNNKYSILNRRICKESDLSKRANYIRGAKQDKDKCVKVTIDNIWRENNRLQKCYYKGNLNFRWDFEAGLSSDGEDETASNKGGGRRRTGRDKLYRRHVTT